MIGSKIGRVLVFTAIGIGAAFPSAAQVQLDFVPSTLNLNLGERALVELRLTGSPTPGLAAFQFDLAFDPLAVDLLNPNEAFRGTVAPFAPLGGNPLCTVVRGTGSCTDPVWLLSSTGRTPLGTDSIDNAAGRIEIAYGTSGAPAPPTGDGAIAFIEVFAEYNGTAVVTLSQVILADNQQPPTPFGAILGSLTITSGNGVANLPPTLTAIGNQQLFEGQTRLIPLTSSDADGNGLALSAIGLPPFCTLQDNGDGTGELECAPSIGQSGIYPITARVTDDGAPNLFAEDTFDLIVDLSTCVDLDADGFGQPGNLSCPLGAGADCDDSNPLIHPLAVESCRSGEDDDCNGLEGAAESFCPSVNCIAISLGGVGTDPTLSMTDGSNCPGAAGLPRGIDLIWGDFASTLVGGGQIDLGAVQAVACGGLSDIEQFDNLTPDPGELDFYLARESGQPAYGVGAGLPRIPSAGDCP